VSNHKQNDKELNEYLQGNSDLSNQYQSQSTKSPSHLDDTILAAAKRQVDAKPRRVAGPFSSSILVPFATAATILITVGLVNMIPEEELTAPTTVPATSSTTSPAPAPLTSSSPSASITSDPKKMAEIRKKMKQHKEAFLENIELEQRKLSRDSQREKLNARRLIAKQAIAEKKQAAVLPTPALPAPVQSAPMAAATVLAESTQDKLTTDKSKTRETQGLLLNKPAMVSALSAPVTPAAKMAAPVDSTIDSIMETSAENKTMDQDTLTLEELIYNKKTWDALSVKEWLKRIEKLRELNRDKEAELILKKFKQKFPDYQDKN